MSREDVIDAIIAKCRECGLTMPEQIAYVLATVEWETDRTFKPVQEAYWLSDDWRRDNLRYYPYHGRGYVQITWEDNYRKQGERLGLDLVANPDLALKHETALNILVHGFKHGDFTGKKLTDFIHEARDGAPRFVDYVNARRCINGTDKAEVIAHMAAGYESLVYERFPIAEQVGPMVIYTNTMRQAAAIDLQEVCRKNGLYHGAIDGIAGPKTSAAVYGLLGYYLLGDPRGSV